MLTTYKVIPGTEGTTFRVEVTAHRDEIAGSGIAPHSIVDRMVDNMKPELVASVTAEMKRLRHLIEIGA